MDTLFETIEKWHNNQPWGHFLDAGTGKHSMQWLLGLQTQSWTAITGDIYRAKALQSEFSQKIRSQDQIIHGNWLHQGFLEEQSFDVILADYLLGSIDGFAPYFQDQLFLRLVPHLAKGGQLYVIGLEPFDDRNTTPEGKIINQISKLRDACILLAGHRCYREYPRSWVERKLQEAGLHIEKSCDVPILFGPRYLNGQLDVCLRKLPFIGPPSLAEELRKKIESIRQQSLSFYERNGPIRFGKDYIIKSSL